MGKKTSACVLNGKLHAPKPTTVDVRDAVVSRQPLIDEGVIRGQQFDHAAVIAKLAFDEKLAFLPERLTQRLIEYRLREELRVGCDASKISQPQPLRNKIGNQGVGALVGQHTADLTLEGSGIAELTAACQVEQFVVGNTVPEKK